MNREIIAHLKALGFKKLPTLCAFIEQQHNKRVKKFPIQVLYDCICQYKDHEKEIPKVEDFIPYDFDGTRILNHEPVFKGWKVAPESSELKKVAELMQDGKRYLIYFHSADGVIAVSQTDVRDQLTYGELAHFFEGNLKLV